MKPRFTITELGLLKSHEETRGQALNDKGQATGQLSLGPFSAPAFLYSDGKMTDIGILPSYRFSLGRGINNHGVIVGACSKTEEKRIVERAFVYEKGVMRDLGTLGGQSSSASAINDKGWIVGRADTASGNSRAFLVRDEKMIDLGTLEGESDFNHYSAEDVNIHGQVVGTQFPGSVFLWQDDVMKPLAGLKGEVSVSAINDSGCVVGTKDGRAYLWRNGKVTYLGGLKIGGGSYGWAVNNKNQVVGAAESSQWNSYGGFEDCAFFHDGQKIYDLNKLVSEKKYLLTSAYSINNAGEILCQGRLNASTSRALLLKPI